MEECRAIPGFDGYEVSDAGNVRSSLAKVLKPTKTKDGYFRVELYQNGASSKHYIHRLVMAAFMCESGLTVDHINAVKTDNRLTNLQYLSRGDNARKALMGRQDTKGSGNGFSKLTENRVREIKEQLRAGLNQKAIARNFNVNNRTISMINTGKTWRHVS